MKQILKLKKKLRSSDSANLSSPQPASVPSAASTSQIATPSCHQSTGSSLTVPSEGSPAPTSTFTATNEAATVSPPSPEPENAVRSVPERLWNEAYNILEEKEPKVVKSYQEILQLVQHEWTDTTAPEELQALEHCKTVKSRQMWRLVYSGLEKSKRQAKLKESVSNIIETIDNLKGVVDKVVKYSSEAAIAWAGVTLGLEILSNPMKEPGINRKGIAYVLSRMEWYWNLVELVLQDNSSAPSATLRTNLETQIIDFYKKLLLFQMKSACLYYRNWAGVILRDAVKLDDWAGELNNIKDAERLIQKDIEQYDNQDIRLKLGTIETSSVDQAESLETICKLLREEARLKAKNEQDDKDRDCLAALLITDPRQDKKRIQSQKGDPLNESYEWILKSDAYQTLTDNSSSRVLWINGPPGKGKTMLLCGIIDELQKSLRPISFFLCQANVKEEDLSSDIAVLRGLIYVLLEHQPSLISAIRPSYDKQKDRLFNSINSSELLGDILTTMLQDPSLNDAILLVDALDECTINRSKLIKLIADLSESCNTKWIVSSRDWPEIQQELADAKGLICLDLEQEQESVSQAVKSYIRKKVDDLAKTTWKNDSELKDKVFDYMQSHADDTFLWVALVCERLANSGIRKRLVMEELVKFPTSLVALYQAMLDRITNSPEADRLKQILALVCIVYRPLSSAEIPTLVEFMDDYDEEDMEDVIASCGSFLTLQNGEIFFVHQSAKEFLLDQGHRILFPHGMKDKHAYIFYRSLEGMEKTLRQDIYELGSPGTLNPVEVPSPDPLCAIKYSCGYWVQHLCKSEFVQDPDLLRLKRVSIFLHSKFTNWLEALSLLGELSTAIASILLLKTTLADIPMQELTDFIHDAHRFIYYHKRAIEIAPLQIYCSALIFSPKSSVIRQHFCYQIPKWIISKPEMGLQWDHNIQTIYTRPNARHASYSPDGCYIAVSYSSGFDLYETLSGDLVRQEERFVPFPVTVYSPDGLFLCCLCSGSVLIFSASTLDLAQELEHNARHCVFLPDGNNIALVYSGDVAVFNWKTGEALSVLNQIIRVSSNIAVLTATHIVGISPTATEVQIWSIFKGECKHNLSWDIGAINSVACSADGRQIAAASTSGIRLWYLDNTLGWIVKHDLYTEGYVYCLAFSEISRMLISGSTDNLIRVWDETGDCAKVLKGHSQPIMFLSVCGNQLASGSQDDTIKLWDLSEIVSDQLRQKQLSQVQACDYSSQASLESSYPDEGLGVHSLLFSPKGSMLALVSFAKTQIWDTTTDICKDILLSGEPSGLQGVNFTPDDKLMAMKAMYGKIRVWNTDVMEQVQFSGLEDRGSVAISADGRYISSLSVSNTDKESVLKAWDLTKYPQTRQYIISEILPLESNRGLSRFIHSEDRQALAVSDSFQKLHILHRRLGNWVAEQLLPPREIPLAFSADNSWLLTHDTKRTSFFMRETTHPYTVKDLGSLKADATTRDTPPLETAWWAIATRYGLLAIGEPGDFEGTAHIGWGLSLQMDWIMRGNERMLWVPADFRRMALDINASRVAFVCPSGHIKIMRFK
ncbi:heterokaryon incompatibility protein het-E-1 [Fusarium pseudoanthophilum]|uniref:Heterokaryon incompatibility protein het-E-1 n=1 Tax=Fusarium pseudoanthophilum TaxID=48495 RepID=A0A8H5NU73_9HYPO|nr:heterokaryon incompatibility protein het-E-1 [Fusarium pseudoanthophilum]